MNILFIDTETTGQNPDKHEIIQIAAEYHVNGEKISSFSTELNRSSIVDLGALKYNGIDLEDIDSVGSLAEGAKHTNKNRVVQFVDYVLGVTRSTKEPIYIGGHNTAFDVGFVNSLLKGYSIEGLGSLFSYRLIDTSTIALFLQSTGVINSDNLSLSSLSKLFSINMSPQKDTDVIGTVGKTFHDAAYDVAVTAKVFYKLQDLVRNTGRTLTDIPKFNAR